jgi:hypothetical protein
MAVTPNPYIPSFLRAALTGSRPLTLTWQQVSNTNIASTSSFQYDPSYVGIKSTQQLNVDWSRFEHHTFFMSAEAKVNLSFDQIINGYPFDGTRQETEVFFENLTGFDKWVFDNFPVFHGELAFSGSSYISVRNKTGALFPELASNTSGQPVLNPTGSTSLTIEMQLYLPPIANDVQMVCQMMSSTSGIGTSGFALYLTQSLSTAQVDATFVVVSGSSYMTVPVTLNKGRFNHLAVELNRDHGVHFLESFLAEEHAADSRTQVEIDDMPIDEALFTIASGTALKYGPNLVTPKQLLTGTIDEFRVFHSARTGDQQAAYASKALFATTDLVLYYRFNEPTGSLDGTNNTNGINSIVLDSSGNSLHTLISNFDFTMRTDATEDPLSPVTNERDDMCPVLFPAYAPIVAFNASLLSTASIYDQENPNLITKLIPQHYLLEGAQHDGFTDPIEGNANQPFGGNGIPGQGQMGNVQIMVSLLYIYARFFDEIKLFLDAFSTLRTVDYDTNDVVAPDTVPDNFLNTLIQNYGFYLPPLFVDSDIDQYVRGENVDIDQFSTNNKTLRYVQHTLTRRVLKSLPSILRSKGTQHSIKAFLRAVGIDPNNIIRMREVGGPTTQQLQFVRENKVEPGAMVWFSGSRLSSGSQYVVSPYLVAPRVEPGFPNPIGTFVQDPATGRNIGTTIMNDNLLTSGSWTWEGIVKFTPSDIKSMHSTTQSIVRMCVAGGYDIFSDVEFGTAGTFGVEGPFGFDVSVHDHLGIVANLLAISSSLAPKLVLYLRPNDYSPTSSIDSPVLRLEIATPIPNLFTGPQTLSMFNGDRWNVSFGCIRGDDGLNSSVSSSYFLRLAYQNNGEIMHLAETSSFFQEGPKGGYNAFRDFPTLGSVLGPFLAVGGGQYVPSGSDNQTFFLNNTVTSSTTGRSIIPDEARVTDFCGRMSNFRFWSKALTLDEWKEHVRNYNSVGVENPLANWNYVNNVTGSFGKLRLNTMVKQENRSTYLDTNPPYRPAIPTYSGSITFLDFSENGLHMTGSGFLPHQEVVVGEIFDLSFYSPYFDEATTNNKIRARSFLDFDLVEQTPWASPAPLYEIDPSETPTDDVRFIMEFSLIEALNRDIITIFSTLDALDNALGDPELLFAPDYPQLENMRDIYFHRIKDKLNFSAFLDFFRWFDHSIGGFVQQLIPRKTNFKGVNFTIESHMLERHKADYSAQSQIYLGDSIRTNLDPLLLLQQLAGNLRKY